MREILCEEEKSTAYLCVEKVWQNPSNMLLLHQMFQFFLKPLHLPTAHFFQTRGQKS